MFSVLRSVFNTENTEKSQRNTERIKIKYSRFSVCFAVIKSYGYQTVRRSELEKAK